MRLPVLLAVLCGVAMAWARQPDACFFHNVKKLAATLLLWRWQSAVGIALQNTGAM